MIQAVRIIKAISITGVGLLNADLIELLSTIDSRMILKRDKKSLSSSLTNADIPISSLIDDCCAEQAAAMIFSTSASAVSNASFIRCENGLIHFAVHDDVPLLPPTLCCVSFNAKNRAHVFLSNVIECDNSANPRQIRIDMPIQVSVAELRSTFRIPIVAAVELHCEVEFAGRNVAAQPKDISLNGLCVELSTALDLNVGDELKINLKLEGQVADVIGEVRNVNDKRVGLMFSDEKNQKLAKLVRSLEMEFLRFTKSQKIETQNANA